MTTPRGSECACGHCHQTFTSLGLFDAHQDVNYRRDPVIICRGPLGLGLGLMQDARGTWGTPEGLKARERSATLLAAARSARAQAFEDADAESWDEPGVDVETMVEAAHKRRRLAQEREAR